jgi:hypothetical protein
MLKAITLCTLLSTTAAAQIDYTTILREGDPVPGFEQDTVGWLNGNNPFIFSVVDSQGDVFFRTQHTDSNSEHHLQRYDANSKSISQFAPSGMLIDGLPGGMMRSPVRFDTLFDGSVVAATLIQGAEDGSDFGLVLLRDGQASLLASNRMPVPGHDGISFSGFNSSPFIEVDGNAQSEVTFKSRFALDGFNHRGVYRGGTGADLTRIIDTTKAVPGHEQAAWDFNTNWLAPFELSGTPITNDGDVYFRAWFQEDDQREMLLLRSRRDGTLETLVDSTLGVSTPGRKDGAAIRGIVHMAQGGGDSVLLTSSTNNVGYSGSVTGGTDVLISRTNGPLVSVFSNESAIPDRADLTPSEFGPQLGAAINMSDQIVVSSHVVHAGGELGVAALFFDSDGAGRFVADGNNLPDQSDGVFAQSWNSVDINENGDILLNARLGNSNNPFALFHWMNATGELQRILQAGMEIDGQIVLEYQLAPSPPTSATDRVLSDNNAIAASVLLLDPTDGSQTWELVHIQVPGSGSLMILGCGLFASIRRKR